MPRHTDYVHGHNNVTAYVHCNICRNFDIKVPDKWYEHPPEPVIEHQKATILRDLPPHTDRKIKANKPDIILKCKYEKACLLIDIAILTDKKHLYQSNRKLSKYKDLEIEIERMWGIKADNTNSD